MGPSTIVDGDDRRRRASTCADGLQWGRRRSSTETTTDGTGTQTLRHRFNGAVDDRRRRLQLEHADDEHGLGASMGPSTIVDGDFALVVGREADHRASMGPSTIVDGDAEVQRACDCSPRRFNGAVDVRRRRPSRYGAMGAAQTLLQWGRRRSSTETLGMLVQLDQHGQASMGPSTIVDGDLERGTSAAPRTPSFNGAVDDRRRRLASVRLIAVFHRASMGPSTIVDGDARAQRGGRAHCRASMGPSTIVDGDPASRPARSPASRASMGPSTSSTETRRSRCWCAEHERASMGPSTFVDGDTTRDWRDAPSPRRFNGAVDVRRRRHLRRRQLEATRGSASMGPSTFVDGDERYDVACVVHASLQWGRRRSSTETQPGQPPMPRNRSASMGPSTFVDGDVDLEHGRRVIPAASMGPSMFVDGDTPGERLLGEGGEASMGPSMFVDGDASQAPELPAASSRFNGAVDVRRRRPRTVGGAYLGGANASMGPSTFVDGDATLRSSIAAR